MHEHLFGRTFLTLLALAATVQGCDEGLGPRPVPVGAFSGVITYAHWPPADSLKDLRLVAFKSYPPKNILNDALSGNAVVYPAIGDTSLVPFFVDSLRYTVVLAAGTYQYVAVAPQYGPILTTDWRAVGQYVTDPSQTTPSPIEITANDTLRNINIHVDFANLPPQPF